MASGPRARGNPGARFLITLVAAVIVLERFAVTAGSQQFPLTVPVVAALVVIGLARGHLLLDRTALLLLGLATSVLALLTVLAAATGRQPSVPALLLLVVVYLPAVVVAADATAARLALGWFVDVMAGFATLGVVLFAGQAVGVGYRDYFAEVVPASLVQTGFNTGDPISYGSSFVRTNGLLFLEPSIFSLFLGLAVVVSMAMRRHRMVIPVLLAAIACTTGGNGVVVLGASCVVLAVVGPDRRRLLLLTPAVVAVAALVALTPLGALFADRSTELSANDSSAGLRLIQPYHDLVPAITSTPRIALVGDGAGAATRLIAAKNPTEAVVTPVLPKLAYEYGVVGLLALGAFLTYVLAWRGRRLVWMPGLLVAYAVLNPSLALAPVAIGSYLFLSILAAGGVDQDVDEDEDEPVPVGVLRPVGRVQPA